MDKDRSKKKELGKFIVDEDHPRYSSLDTARL